MADTDTPPLSGIPAGPLTTDTIRNVVYQEAQARANAQKAQMGQYDQQAAQYGQKGMSDIDKASILFQAAGALASPTRSGGLMESIGAAGTAVAGPLSKAAQTERDRQDKMAQLQLARAKLSAEMGSGGPSSSDLMSLYKLQQADEEKEESFKPMLIAPGKYAMIGSKGTLKPVPSDIMGDAGGSSELTGDDYLKSIPAKRAMTVKGMAEGNIPVPTPGSKAAERMTAELEDLKQYLQDDRAQYEAVASGNVYNRRKQMGADMASDKPNTIGFAVRSAGKLMGHIDDFAEAAENMDNYDTKLLNAARWKKAEQLGGTDAAKLTAFKTTQNTASGEAARAIKGGVPALAEVQHNLELAHESMSPDGYQAYFDNQMKLVRDAMTPYMNNYNRVMGTKFNDVHDFIKEFTPDAAKHVDRMSNLAIKGSQKYKDMQKQKEDSAATPQGKTIVATGVVNSGPNAGKRVVKYSDGTQEYQ
jgi:hypothetical protein